jgi:hypothetical protein
LKNPEINIFIVYIVSSARIRRMSFKDLAKDPYLNLNCSTNTIKNALYKRGYHRRLARYKPLISEKNRILRLEFTYEYRHWTEK